MLKSQKLAIIPARGGSKRIPRKNIKLFAGQPMIVHAIRVAVDSGVFDKVMVSTDDTEIATIAKAAGAEVPFLRSAQNSDDHSSITDVIIEVLNCYEQQGHNFADFACIYPTAALLQSSRLVEAHRLTQDPSVEGVLAVSKFGFPIQRALIERDGHLDFFDRDSFFKRSQDLMPAFHDCGQFFFSRSELFKKNRTVIGKNTKALVVPEYETQDIDNEDDWILAEIKYEFLQKKKSSF